MIIEETQLSLKDGRKAVLKNPMPEDAEAVLFHMKQTAGETDFLVRYPEEIHLTVEEEKEFLEDLRGGCFSRHGWTGRWSLSQA